MYDSRSAFVGIGIRRSWSERMYSNSSFVLADAGNDEHRISMKMHFRPHLG